MSERKIISYAWVVWIISALFYGAEFFQRVAPGVIADPLQHTFQIDHATLGLIMSLYFWAYGIAQLPVGVMLDKFGARICLTFAAFAVSCGTLLFATAHFVWILALARILVGVGSAFAFVGCLKLAHFWFDRRLFPLIVGLTNTLGVIGALFGEEPLSDLVSAIGWQESLLISGVAGIGVGVLIAIFVRNYPNDHRPLELGCQQPVVENFKSVLCRPQSWLISIYAGLMVAPVIAFGELWAVPYLESAYHLGSAFASEATSAIFVGIAVGGPLHGFLTAFFRKRKGYMAICQLFAILAFVVVIMMTNMSYIHLVLSLFAFGFFISSMLLAFPIHTAQMSKRMSGIVIAFTNMLIMITGAIFQPLIGKLVDLFSSAHFSWALMVLPAALVLNFIVLFFIKETAPSKS